MRLRVSVIMLALSKSTKRGQMFEDRRNIEGLETDIGRHRLRDAILQQLQVFSAANGASIRIANLGAS